MYKISDSLIPEKMSDEQIQEMSQSLRSHKPFGNKILDEDIRKYINFGKGSVMVDWEGFVELEDSPSCTDKKLYNSAIDNLFNLNVLTFSREYFVNREGVCVNPRKNGGPVLYFSRKKDAIDYAVAERGNSTNCFSVSRDF